HHRPRRRGTRPDIGGRLLSPHLVRFQEGGARTGRSVAQRRLLLPMALGLVLVTALVPEVALARGGGGGHGGGGGIGGGGGFSGGHSGGGFGGGGGFFFLGGTGGGFDPFGGICCLLLTIVVVSLIIRAVARRTSV